jgi:hypothetical protein
MASCSVSIGADFSRIEKIKVAPSSAGVYPATPKLDCTVIGLSHKSIAVSRCSSSPANRPNADAGNRFSSTGGMKRLLSLCHNRVAIKPVCQKRCQRRTVRLGTFASVALQSGLAQSAERKAATNTTTAPTYTLRPKNRTDRGV